MVLQRIVDNLFQLAALVVLIAASGLLSASETALFSLTRQQLAHFRQSPRLGAQLVLRLREDPASLLATILLGNTTVNILLFSILAVTAGALAGGSALWTPVVGLSGFLVVVVFAEILPKLVALVLSVALAPIVALPLRLLEIVTAPLRWVMTHVLVEPLVRIAAPTHAPGPNIRPEELQELVNVSQATGLIDGRENTMLHQLMELTHCRVGHLMVPRVDVVAFDLDGDPASLPALIQSSRLLKIPVYRGNIDQVFGLLDTKAFLLHPGRPVEEMIRPVHFIPEQASVEALLQHYRSTGSQLAMVVDEYGGLAGVVAMEDVVEEIVGELYAPDEVSAHPPLERVDDRTFLVDAGVDLDDFASAFHLKVEASRYHTVGGLIASELDRIPTTGDTVCLGDARLTVVSMRRRRILRARLDLSAPAEDNPDLSRLLEGRGLDRMDAFASPAGQKR
jgi:CBS domain containing-hemolysin-like protein